MEIQRPSIDNIAYLLETAVSYTNNPVFEIDFTRNRMLAKTSSGSGDATINIALHPSDNCDMLLFIKNTRGSDIKLELLTGTSTNGGITYTYLRNKQYITCSNNFTTVILFSCTFTASLAADIVISDLTSKFNGISFSDFGNDLKGNLAMSGNDIDLSLYASFTKTLSVNTTITLSNPSLNKCASLRPTGAYTITLSPPLGYTLVELSNSDSYTSGKSTYYFRCRQNSEIEWFIKNDK